MFSSRHVHSNIRSNMTKRKHTKATEPTTPFNVHINDCLNILKSGSYVCDGSGLLSAGEWGKELKFVKSEEALLVAESFLAEAQHFVEKHSQFLNMWTQLTRGEQSKVVWPTEELS